MAEWSCTLEELERIDAYIREHFDVDVERGVVLRKKRVGKFPAGSEPGYAHWYGYRMLTVAGRVMQRARVIFYSANSHMPPCIDHIDGDPTNDAISNLRPATHYQNMRNRKKRSSASGVTGVYRNGSGWRAQVSNTHIKRFDNFEDAVRWRKEMERRVFGEWSRAAALQREAS